MARVYVGNLDFAATDEQIGNLFTPFGEVSKVTIATDWETGHSGGFAFVEMKSANDAEKAIKELSGIELNGRSLTIREAPPALPTGFDSLSLGRE